MRKVLLTVILLTLRLFSMNAAQRNCAQDAIDVFDSEEDRVLAYIMMTLEYENCVENGGYPGDTSVDL